MLKQIHKDNQNEFQQYLLSRVQEISADILVRTSDILRDVQTRKDQACQEYTLKFDGVRLENMKVEADEWEQAVNRCSDSFKEALQRAKKNIEFFHRSQVQSSYTLEKEMGIYLGQRVLPLASVGIYVPGGRAQYPSSVLMNAVPAKVAGVSHIVMVTPPDKNGGIHPNIAYAAKLAGVDEIYKIGGAQAIGALAYGTQSIPKVDKIVGPGNIYVAAAKKLVYGIVDIDMIAGPSEILVIADQGADPSFVAADLLSQAEHDPMASAILLSDSQTLIDRVNEQIAMQTEQLPKKEIVLQSLRDYGVCMCCSDLNECVAIANELAPEHLELMVENPRDYLDAVKNAGSVFMGYYTCESIGDYYGGTNHVLPTSGTARFSSALGVDSFIKKSCFLHYTQEALQAYAQDIVTLAEEEQLQAHANAVKVRR